MCNVYSLCLKVIVWWHVFYPNIITVFLHVIWLFYFLKIRIYSSWLFLLFVHWCRVIFILCRCPMCMLDVLLLIDLLIRYMYGIAYVLHTIIWCYLCWVRVYTCWNPGTNGENHGRVKTLCLWIRFLLKVIVCWFVLFLLSLVCVMMCWCVCYLSPIRVYMLCLLRVFVVCVCVVFLL